MSGLGGNPISWADLVDFTNNQDVKGAIKDLNNLTKAYEAFNSTVTGGMMERLSQQQSDLTASIRELLNVSKDLNITQKEGQKLIISYTETMRDYNNSINQINETKKKAQQTDQAAEDSIVALTATLKVLVSQYGQLSQAEALNSEQGKRLAADIRNTKDQIALLNNALKTTVTTFSAAKGSYDALDAETKVLVRDLKGLEGGLSSTSVRAQELKSKIFENTAQLKAFDAEINQNFRNVGNYGSAFNGVIGDLRGFYVVIASLTALIHTFDEAFDKSLTFDSLQRTIEFTSGSVAEGVKNLTFLRETAQELGLEFVPLVKNFNQLTAATKGTNLEGERTRKIFQGVAEAAAVMKLPTESVTGVFVALEQIVSKGRVATEELRKQLGNQLPGAFELFAKSLNISTKELNEFLKKGEITKDALVPFADQLKKTFDPGLEKNVDGLQAATNRLKNTLGTFFQGQRLNDFFTAIIKGFNYLLSIFDDTEKKAHELAVTSHEQATSATALVGEYEKLKTKTNLTATESDRLLLIQSQLVDIFGKSVIEINKETGAYELNIAKVKELITQKLLLANDNASSAAAKYIKSQDVEKESVKELTGLYQEALAAARQYGLSFKDIEAKINAASGARNEFAKPTFTAQEQEVVKLLDRYNALNRSLNDARVTQAKALADLKDLGFDEKDINSLLSPGAAGAPLKVFEDDDSEAKRLARLRKIKEFYDAQRNLAIQQAQLEFENSSKSYNESIAFQNKKNDINQLYYTKEANLFSKNEKEYIESEANKVKSASDRAKAIDKINIDQLEKDRQEKLRQATADFEASNQSFIEQQNFEDKKLSIEETTFEKKLFYYSLDADAFQKGLKEKQDAENRFAKNSKEIAEATYKFNREIQDKERQANTNRDVNSVRLKFASLPKNGKNSAAAEDEEYDIRHASLVAQQADYQSALDNLSKQDKNYLDLFKKNEDLKNKILEDSANQQIKIEERVAAQKQALLQQGFETGKALIDAYAQVQQEALAAELEAITKQHDADIAAAGDNADAKTRIDADFNKKALEIKRQQDQATRQQAIFDATIAGAEAVAKALASGPPPLNFYLAALVGAASAVEIATIVGKPLPAYFKGRSGGPGEVAIVNEKGPELLESNGKLRIAGDGSPTMTYLKPGEKVHTYEQSVAKMARDFSNNSASDGFIDSLLDGTNVYRREQEQTATKIVNALIGTQLTEGTLSRAFAAAVSDITIEQHNFDESGYSNFTIKRGQRNEQLKNRNKFGGA